jgi:hypothetical protein
MWLNDTHMTCAQTLLKHLFPQYGGLQCTVLQQTKSLKPLPEESLQILHTRGNHWIAVSTVNCTTVEVTVYDSKYSKLSSDTEMLLAQIASAHGQICCICENSQYDQTVWFFRLRIVCGGVHHTYCIWTKSMFVCISAKCYERASPKMSGI